MGKGFNLARIAQQFGVGWMRRQAQVKEEARQEKFKLQNKYIDYLDSIHKNPNFNTEAYGDQVHRLMQSALNGKIPDVQKGLVSVFGSNMPKGHPEGIGSVAEQPQQQPFTQQDGKSLPNSAANTGLVQQQQQKPRVFLDPTTPSGS